MNKDEIISKRIVAFTTEQGNKYLLDEDGCVMVFDNDFDAMYELLLRGCINAVPSEELPKFEFLKPIGICSRCGGPMFKSDIDGYVGQCFHCDEDFYSFEFESLIPENPKL